MAKIMNFIKDLFFLFYVMWKNVKTQYMSSTVYFNNDSINSSLSSPTVISTIVHFIVNDVDSKIQELRKSHKHYFAMFK